MVHLEEGMCRILVWGILDLDAPETSKWRSGDVK